jgi:hypothetical protein
MEWIDVRVRKPTKDDADDKGLVLQLLKGGVRGFYWWDHLAAMVAWMPIPKFEKIDPPQGYRLIDTATEPFRNDALWWSTRFKEWTNTCGLNYGSSLLHCVPIDPPKPKYRPFKNGDEFRPFREKWVRAKDGSHVTPPQSYCDTHWCGLLWQHAFEQYEFDDGTPFGMKVSEED